MRHLVMFFLCFVALIASLSSGCGDPAECRFDTDCPRSNSICNKGKCELLTLPDGSSEPFIPDIPPSECQDGNIRRCYTGPEGTEGVGACKGGRQRCSGGKWGACEEEVTPQTESCDQVDNNCNGLVDEGCPCTTNEERPCYPAPNESRAHLPCKAGVQRCKEDGTWGDTCTGASLPKTEVCNGIDDDCNGQIDDIPECACKEGEKAPCYNHTEEKTAGVGICQKGEMICRADRTWGACVGAIPPAVEDCNGKDDDCDGIVDNNCDCIPGQREDCYTGPAGTADRGICKKGSRSCDSKGKWLPCEGDIKPAVEECNGKDDDCDGQIDNGLTAPACDLQAGVCAGSKKTCQGAQGWAACDAAAYKLHDQRYEEQENTCDNLDNDCDGKIDENLSRACFTGASGCTAQGASYACQGLCQSGTQSCSAGAWGVCQGEILPDRELCDNLDNDCDGRIDNDCLCTVGQTRPCYNGPAGTLNTGVCREGTQNCVSIGNWGACQGAITPSPEICNGLDDNCNGSIDEGITAPACSKTLGACAGTRQTCLGQAGWRDCTHADYLLNNPAYEQTETLCDNLDNDCDGQIDENLSQSCYSGPQGTAGVGICRAGSQICNAGTWGACIGQVLPQTEICDNNLDDNCDGQIDECRECNPGQTRPCYTASTGCVPSGAGYTCQGGCSAGTQGCVGGRWATSCTGESTPQVELCDWQDNDCDGQIDNAGACLFSRWTAQPLPTGASGVGFVDRAVGIAFGTLGRVWRTTDGGATWASLTIGTTATLRAIATGNRGLIAVVGDGGTILVSRNNGESFALANSGTNVNLFGVTIANQTNLIAVGSSGIVATSPDGGFTWSASNQGGGQQLYAVATSSETFGTQLAVGDNGTILRSTNYGTSWVTISSGTTQSLRAIAWSTTSEALVTGAGGTILRTTNSGSLWNPLTFGETITLDYALSSGRGTYVLAAANRSDFFLSIDSGTTFHKRPLGTSGNYTGIALKTPTALLAIRSGGGAVGEGPIQYNTRGDSTWIYGVSYSNRYGGSTALACGNSGLLLFSNDNGLSWSRVFSPVTTTLYSISFSGNTAIAVGSSGVILRSTDGGRTWSQVTSGTSTTLWGVAVFEQTSPTSTIALAVGTGGLILRSIDGGATWASVTTPTSSTLYGITFKDSIAIAVGSSGTILRSTNAGSSWASVTSGTTSELRGVYTYGSLSSDIALAVGSSGTILRSTNAGSSWTSVSSGVTATLRGVAIDFSRAVVVGHSGVILSSANGGSTWTNVSNTNSAVWYYSVFRNYGTNLYAAVGDYGIISRSTDYGVTWTDIRPPVGSLRAVTQRGSNQFVTTGSYGVFLRSSDNGETWQSRPTNSSTFFGIATNAGNTNNLVAVGSVGLIRRSIDGGVSWSIVTSPSTSTFYGVGPMASNNFVTVGSSGTILHSADSGASWNTRTSGTTQTLQAVHCLTNNCLAVGNGGTIVRSTNNLASSWSASTTPTGLSTLFSVAQASTTSAVAVGSSGAIVFSNNGGASWVSVTSPTTSTFYKVVSLGSGRYLASDASGVFYASPNGQSWHVFSPALNALFYGFDLLGNNGVGVGDNHTFLRYLAP